MLAEGTYDANTMPEYEPYGYKIPVKVNAKNLFDGQFVQGHTFDTKLTTNRLHKKIGYLEAGTYTFSVDQPGQIISITAYKTDKYAGTSDILVDTNWKEGAATITTTEGAYFAVQVRKVDNLAIVLDDVKDFKFQLEKGNKATNYEIYKGETYNIYLDEPLRKIGDSVDYIDFENKKLIRNIGEYNFTGMEKLTLSSNTTNDSLICYTNSIKPSPKINGEKGFCNIGKGGKLNQMPAYSSGFFYNINEYHFLKINNSVISNYNSALSDSEKVSVFKGYLSDLYTAGTPINIVYELSNQTEKDIELPNISTIKGNSTISVATPIKPSEFIITSYK